MMQEIAGWTISLETTFLTTHQGNTWVQN